MGIQTSKHANTFLPNTMDFGSILGNMLQDTSVTPICLPIEFLKSITCNFSKEQELGRGGSGVVYKGILQNGKMIAVNKLSEIQLEDDQFEREVTYIINVKHQNIVQLVGYCAESRWEATEVSRKYVMAETGKRLLCFEYLPNNSLDKHISVCCSSILAESCGLEWQMRYAIIRGVCCGLHYLHAECRIVHLDLKPQNILLDDNMLPKLADFGISRLFDQQQSRIITEHRAGTFGYMAPEYIANGLITTKSDMFSLGVIIIELMTGRREYPQSSEMPYEDFVKNVIGNWRNRLKRTLGYKALEICSQQIERCIVLALKCVNPDPKDIIQLMNEPESTSSIFDQNEEPRVWQESEVLIFSGSKDLSYYSSSAIEFNNIMGSQGRILTLEALPEDKAWDLFCKKSFPTEINNECPNDLKPLSKEIFSKCQGLPLAILLVGSLLHEHEKTVEEWRSINDQLSWEMINNSRLDHIRNVLQLSFIYLPTYLKSCFLYCSLFPGDHLFQRKTLVRLWMAEGFIIEKGESTLEQVAEGYLKELVNRNMLQLVGRNTFGRMKTFRMHDTVGELAVDLCKEPNFGVKYEEDKCGGFLQMDGQRVVVHKLKKDIQQSFSSIHGLWTFIALDKNMPSFTLLPHLSKKSRYMKVLELSGLPIEKVPDAIGDLFNLRHLGLRDTKVKLLPKSIEKLSNLLTLDLCRSEIREVPAGIVKLNNLRHLFAEKVNDLSGTVIHTSSGVCITKGLGNLTNLQTLQALEAQDESVRQLGELKQLRSLRILNVKGIYSERLCESLVQMPFLSYLDVRASDENEVLMLSALPHNLQKRRLNGRLSEGTLLGESPLLQAAEQNLHDLRLRWSQLREDPLPSLSRLANLTVLVFTRAYNGEKLEFLTGWFPRLKILYMKDMPNLKQLEIKKGAMTTLEELELSNLSGMAGVPCGIELLLPLQSLGFYEITEDFLELLYKCSGLADVQWGYSLRD